MLFKRIVSGIARRLLVIGKEEVKPVVSLGPKANVGESTQLLNGSSVRFDVGFQDRNYVTIGEKGIIQAAFVFESHNGKVEIGNNVHIGGATFISRNSIIVEDDVTMAWDITIYDHDSHSVYWNYRKNDSIQCYDDFINNNGNNVVNKDWTHVNSKPIRICAKSWIGFGVTVLKGVTIGEGAVVGAKSVVTKNVPAWTVVAGNPARIIKYLNNHTE